MSFADEGGEIAPRLSGASNVLVLTPAMSEPRENACERLLSGMDTGGANVFAVTYQQNAEGWLDSHLGTLESQPGRLAIVDVGGAARTVPNADSEPLVPEGFTVDAIENPSDLTGLGIKINDYLESLDAARWHEAANEVTVCFDSVTALLQYVSTERAFRFLHVFTGRVAESSATAHYHLDPSAHDDQTVATLQSLFDAVLEADKDGSWTVRTR